MTITTDQRPIDPSLFTWSVEKPSLLATRCKDCEALMFPVNNSCKSCGSLDVEEQELPRRGKLWAWTVQRFMPKTPYNSSETPETFQPFAVGYVELPGLIRVEGRMIVDDFEKLEVGADMELDFYPHRYDADGTEVMNYAFRLVE